MRDLAGREGETVRVCGWVHRLPPPTATTVTLRDHTGLVVLVSTPELDVAELDVAVESAIEATGTVVPGADGSGGVPHVALDDLRVVGPAAGPFPIDNTSPLEARLDWRYLDLRRPRARLAFEVQTTLERAMRAWWAEHGFIELHSPRLRATPNRSGRELFTVDYFGRPAYLAQSPQFAKQMAMAAGLDRVFEIGPAFRANPLVTDRHDTEFTSVDVEISWIDSHQDVMAVEEEWLVTVLAAVEAEHGEAIRRLYGRDLRVPEAPLPRVTLAEAHVILAARGHAPAVAGGDIDAAGERLLGAHVAESLGHEFVFVTDYPAAARPFYHMRLDDQSDVTRSFDLLWNGLEVTTGAQREHRHDRLVAQAGAGADPARAAALGTYLDFFRHGCPPHGGFGLGLTRVLMCLLGVDDVREVTYLPRDRNRLTPP